MEFGIRNWQGNKKTKSRALLVTSDINEYLNEELVVFIRKF